MTTGTKTADGRYYWTSSCGYGWSGFFKQKTWSGLDHVPAAKPQYVVTPRTADIFRLEPYITKDGQRRIRKVRTGVSQFNVYRRLGSKPPKRARHRAEHDYSMDLIEFWYPAYQRRIPSQPGVTFNDNQGCGHCGVGGTWSYLAIDPNQEILAVNKLREKLVGEFDVGVFLVEADKSLSMIVNAARRIDGFYRAVRQVHLIDAALFALDSKKSSKVRTKIKMLERDREVLMLRAENLLVSGTDRSYKRRRKGAANSWLELQYGWLPLLHDAYEGANSLARILNNPMRRTVKAARFNKDSLVPMTTSPSSTGWSKGSRKNLVAIKAIITEVNVPLLTGLTNPTTMIWERLPFSFVVDWFLPIQSYLQARGAQQAVTGTFVTTRMRTRECKGIYPKGFTLIGTSEMYERRIELRRTVTYSLNVPLPHFKPLRQALSWKHSLNALALLLK